MGRAALVTHRINPTGVPSKPGERATSYTTRRQDDKGRCQLAALVGLTRAPVCVLSGLGRESLSVSCSEFLGGPDRHLQDGASDVLLVQLVEDAPEFLRPTMHRRLDVPLALVLVARRIRPRDAREREESSIRRPIPGLLQLAAGLTRQAGRLQLVEEGEIVHHDRAQLGSVRGGEVDHPHVHLLGLGDERCGVGRVSRLAQEVRWRVGIRTQRVGGVEQAKEVEVDAASRIIRL